MQSPMQSWVVVLCNLFYISGEITALVIGTYAVIYNIFTAWFIVRNCKWGEQNLNPLSKRPLK